MVACNRFHHTAVEPPSLFVCPKWKSQVGSERVEAGCIGVASVVDVEQWWEYARSWNSDPEPSDVHARRFVAGCRPYLCLGLEKTAKRGEIGNRN